MATILTSLILVGVAGMLFNEAKLRVWSCEWMLTMYITIIVISESVTLLLYFFQTYI